MFLYVTWFACVCSSVSVSGECSGHIHKGGVSVCVSALFIHVHLCWVCLSYCPGTSLYVHSLCLIADVGGDQEA